MTEILIQVLQAAALRHVERCELGRELDAGFDAGEFSGGPRQGEEEAHEFLHVSGFWKDQELWETHAWLCHPDDPEECDGGATCFLDPTRFKAYEHALDHLFFSR
jgi:hypothetical protein